MTKEALRKLQMGPAIALLATANKEILFANIIFTNASGFAAGTQVGDGLPSLMGIVHEADIRQTVIAGVVCLLTHEGEAWWSVQAIPLARSGSMPGVVLIVATDISSQAVLSNTLKEQDESIKAQDDTIEEKDESIKAQDETIEEQGESIKAQGVVAEEKINIIDRQRETIEHQASLLKLLMAYVPWGVTIADNNFQIERISQFGSDLLSNPLKDEPGITIDFFHKNGEPAGLDEMPLMRSITKGETIIDEEWLVPGKIEGKRRTLLCNAAPMRDANNEIIGGITTYGDITVLKDMLGRLHELVEQKEILLSELHHRVKNNLQMVTSIALMEKIRHPEASAPLDNILGHVSSVAAIHETLGLSNDVTRVPFGLYVCKICQELQNIHSPTAVKISTRGMEQLPLDVATSLGLIINELVTNSLKHAFGSSAEGIIQVSLDKDSTMYCLKVADDGIGLPEPYQPSLGLRLVNRLVQQIGGSLHTSSVPGAGTTWRVHFPFDPNARDAASH